SASAIQIRCSRFCHAPEGAVIPVREQLQAAPRPVGATGELVRSYPACSDLAPANSGVALSRGLQPERVISTSAGAPPGRLVGVIQNPTGRAGDWQANSSGRAGNRWRLRRFYPWASVSPLNRFGAATRTVPRAPAKPTHEIWFITLLPAVAVCRPRARSSPGK